MASYTFCFNVEGVTYGEDRYWQGRIQAGLQKTSCGSRSALRPTAFLLEMYRSCSSLCRVFLRLCIMYIQAWHRGSSQKVEEISTSRGFCCICSETGIFCFPRCALASFLFCHCSLCVVFHCSAIVLHRFKHGLIRYPGKSLLLAKGALIS